MANNRIKKSTPLLTTQGKRLALAGAGGLALLALAFAAGVGYGKQLGEKSAVPLAADPLAALDAPPRSDDPGAAPAPGEPVKEAAAAPADFSFHQALTDARPGAARPSDDGRAASIAPPAQKQPVLTAGVAGAGRDGGAPAPATDLAPTPATASAAPRTAAAPANGRAGAAPGSGPTAAARAPAPAAPSPARARLVASARAPEPKPTGLAGAGPIPAGAFSVQVGASQSLEEAQRIAARFKGRHPHIVSSEVSGKGRWYRVRLGVFSSRADAGRYLRDSGLKGFVTAAR